MVPLPHIAHPSFPHVQPQVCAPFTPFHDHQNYPPIHGGTTGLILLCLGLRRCLGCSCRTANMDLREKGHMEGEGLCTTRSSHISSQLYCLRWHRLLNVHLGLQLLSLNSPVRFIHFRHEFQLPPFSDRAMTYIGDILADSILVIAPLRLLRHLDNNFPERRRLLFVFSSSIVTTITSLIHAYYILRVGGLIVVFTALIEVRRTVLLAYLFSRLPMMSLPSMYV